MFNGGVSRGLKPLRYDQNDFYLITDDNGNRLGSKYILGLADMSNEIPDSDNFATDNDNFIDICLNLKEIDTESVKKVRALISRIEIFS